MRAARIDELGSPPAPAEIEGDGEIAVVAVALNPLDLAVGAGRFYGGHPPLPYVPGAEAVGRLDGTRVYLFGEGFGTKRDGFLRERTDFPADLAVPVPDELDDALAAATGIAGTAAWVPLARLARVRKDDRVLVLGATGLVGTIAVQVARLLGAERVVGAGRDEARLARLRELGADTTVRLEGEGLAARMRERLRRRRPDDRLRPGLGRARTGGRRGGGAPRADREPRSVRRARGDDHVRRREREAAHDRRARERGDGT